LKLSQKENQDESQKKIEIKAAFGEETGKKILSTLRNIKNMEPGLTKMLKRKSLLPEVL